MTVTITPGALAGEAAAIPSKSHLHRLLICAALADAPTTITCAPTQAADITATISCLEALGAKILWQEGGLAVTPIDRAALPREAVLPCGESGSTLRFMLPVVCALGVRGRFEMSGRLPERPLYPLDKELTSYGARLSRPQPDVLCCEGQLVPARFLLPGNVSSQYITGMLLAQPLLQGDSALCIRDDTQTESVDYITMTLNAAAVFGKVHEREDIAYLIEGGKPYLSPGKVDAEGDWSNAAFWLCAGAMPGGNITHTGLNRYSVQGDRQVTGILTRMGAKVAWKHDVLISREGERRGANIDARAIPDLIPVLCAVAAVGNGETTVTNAARLRLKESDRIASTAQTLSALGADITETPDGLRIVGQPALRGGSVDSWGDHRIAMMAAVASVACREPVKITNADAVNKSYPTFWQAFSSLGGRVMFDE